MQKHPGVFIVLEGSDGSGKGTQFRLLTERLKAVGHDIAVFDFPQYEKPSSHFVRSYLNGDYGPASEISPYTASIFYALDRYEAAPHIKNAIDEGKVVLANRYVGSNMAHQGAKFTNTHEQRGFFMWAENLEFQLLGIPRPNLNLFLKVSPSISQQLIEKRAAVTGVILDEHEKNQSHLSKAVDTYVLLCKLFPKDFREIDCTLDNQLLTIVEINDMIWEALKPLLPKPKRRGKGATISLEQSGYINAAEDKKNDAKSSPLQAPNGMAKFDKIHDLHKQMLTKAGQVRELNQDKLKAAIGLVRPLLTRKDEIKDLIKEVSLDDSTQTVSPVPLGEIIEEISKSIPESDNSDRIELLQCSPRNELKVLNHANTEKLSYRQKQQLLNNRLKNAGLKISYEFEVVSDFNLLFAFRSEVRAKPLELITCSPILGYNVPEIIEAAGLEDLYRKAFEVSSKLYGQASDSEAIYNLLLGHNVRWRFEISAAALSNALNKSKNPDLLGFFAQLVDKIAEKHPHTVKIITSHSFNADKNIHKKRR